MLTGVHFLLTYMCSFECDHCFLYCSPRAEGTFTFDQIERVFKEIKKIGTIEWVYFEGGEPFLFYPLMLEGIRLATEMDLKTGIVTNAYWATSVADAKIWLVPIRGLGVSDLSLSDDSFHFSEEKENPAKLALQAAEEMKLPVGTICIEEPTTAMVLENGQEKGEPVVGGGVRFRGRAVEKLTEGLPKKPWEEFTECPHEELEEPKRVHIDSYGNVQVCQGISIGNMEETPLSTIIKEYQPHAHPVCGPLLKGGPAQLSRAYHVDHEDRYVDACQFCYLVRLALVDRFPQYLAPRQVYGLENRKS